VLWQLPHVDIAPSVIFHVFNFPVTNTLLCTWISIIVLLALFYAGTRRRDLIPRGVQNLTEWIVESLRGLVESVAGKEHGKKFFPLVATFFIFIFVSNLLDIFPGVDTVGAIDGQAIQAMHTASKPVLGFLLFGDISNAIIPWIRPATTDLNLTFAMALISVITTQAFGFYMLGPREHISKYLNFKSPIDLFVGLLEVISELARIISFSFRLFGNIFAGSTVLAVFAFVLPFLADIVFIPFEIFVAFIQALVFSLLTLVFLEIASTSHEHSESEAEAHAEFERNEQRAQERELVAAQTQ
jgi:F-type H+-transporting ATPase subunit a